MRRRDAMEGMANSPGEKPRALFQSVEIAGCTLIRARKPVRSLTSAPFQLPRPKSIHDGQIHIARYGTHIGLQYAYLTFHQCLQSGELERGTSPEEESETASVLRK